MNVITKRLRLSRRLFLKGLTATHAPVAIGLPPLVSMFNASGTAYAAEAKAAKRSIPVGKRFVLWFNGNGIPERYWIPEETGPAYDMTPFLEPCQDFRAGICNLRAQQIQPPQLRQLAKILDADVRNLDAVQIQIFEFRQIPQVFNALIAGQGADHRKPAQLLHPGQARHHIVPDVRVIQIEKLHVDQRARVFGLVMVTRATRKSRNCVRRASRSRPGSPRRRYARVVKPASNFSSFVEFAK